MPPLPLELVNHKVLVLGAGVSGLAATRLLHHIGAHPLVVEDNPIAAAKAADSGEEVCSMEDAVAHLDSARLVVSSPGIPPHLEFFDHAAVAQVPVWGDVELCWHVDRAALRGPSRVWLAVTGTNGKTTTTGMVTAICQQAGMAAVSCGNIGYPIEDALLDPHHPDVLVCELSSFQLYWAPSVRPLAGALLNIDEDHLDWHGSVDNYVAAKARVLNGHYAIVGRDDPHAVAAAATCTAHQVIGFRLGEPQCHEIGVHDGGLYDHAFGPNDTPRFLIECADISPAGPAGILDAGAAASLALAAGATPQDVHDGLKAFTVAPHRNVVVHEDNGVTFVDDSKATNPHAARSSMLGYPSIVWIGGGQLKGANIDPLVKEVAGRLRGAVILGKDGDIIVEALRTHCPEVPVHRITTGDDGSDTPPPVEETEQAMHEAVAAARSLAKAGDTVLLAPAAASYDMFRGYSHRGELFTEAVRAS